MRLIISTVFRNLYQTSFNTNLGFNDDFFQKNAIINAVVQLEIAQVKIS